MDSTYEVVCYEPGLRGQVIELQSHLWSPNAALNTAYFEWKYERNPYVDAPLIYLAMHNGKAVGMRGFWGMQWEGGIPTQESIALYADDLVIAPAHRNRGLIPKIMAAAFEDLGKRSYQYAFNLSAGPITFLSSLATGWRSVGSMQPMRQRSWRVALRSGRGP
jgi:GNAT superfamily N-acetyltransferase